MEGSPRPLNSEIRSGGVSVLNFDVRGICADVSQVHTERLPDWLVRREVTLLSSVYEQPTSRRLPRLHRGVSCSPEHRPMRRIYLPVIV